LTNYYEIGKHLSVVTVLTILIINFIQEVCWTVMNSSTFFC